MNPYGRSGMRQIDSIRLSEAARCTRCKQRWRQSTLGLCRQCERELGIDERDTAEREKDKLSRAARKTASAQGDYLTPQQRAARANVARRPRVIAVHPSLSFRDRDYVVIWAGDMDGAKSMGLPLSQDKRASYTGRQEPWGAPEQRGSGLRRGDFIEG